MKADGKGARSSHATVACPSLDAGGSLRMKVVEVATG